MSVSDIKKHFAELQNKKEEMLKSEKTAAIKQVKQLVNDYKITMGSIGNVIFVGFDSKGKGKQADLSNVKAKNKNDKDMLKRGKEVSNLILVFLLFFNSSKHALEYAKSTPMLENC